MKKIMFALIGVVSCICLFTGCSTTEENYYGRGPAHHQHGPAHHHTNPPHFKHPGNPNGGQHFKRPGNPAPNGERPPMEMRTR